MKRSPEREIKRADADRFQGIRKCLVALQSEAFTPDHDGNSGDQADRDSAGGTDPVIFECEFQEIRDANQQGGDADAVQPVGTDAGFEIGLQLARNNGTNWARWLDGCEGRSLWNWPRRRGRREGTWLRRRLRVHLQAALDAVDAGCKVDQKQPNGFQFALRCVHGDRRLSVKAVRLARHFSPEQAWPRCRPALIPLRPASRLRYR